MKKILVMELKDKRLRGKNIVYEEHELYSLITLKNSERMIKKVIKKYSDRTIVVSNDFIEEKLLQGLLKPYNAVSMEIVLQIIENLCRKLALKCDLKLPLEDVHIYANPSLACEFIKRLIGLSRIYTIVSNEKKEKSCDEIYFKYGYPIRCVGKSEVASGIDIISIFVEECGNTNSPIINITESKITGSNVLDVREIMLPDECSVKGLEKSNGLCLHTIMNSGAIENLELDINKKAEPIFLLDTKAF